MFSYFRIVNNLVFVTVYHFNPSLIFAGKAKIQVAPLRLVGFKLGLSCDIYKSQVHRRKHICSRRKSAWNNSIIIHSNKRQNNIVIPFVNLWTKLELKRTKPGPSFQLCKWLYSCHTLI
jgi:hypothetical protein